MDRLEAMSILLLTVEKGSFTAAAKALGMPLPTVSRKVSDLETHLGAQLLLRTTRKLSLTDAGLAYVAASRRILEEVAEAERVASGEYDTPRGELVLTAPILFGRLHLLPVVTDFLAAYPDITVRLSLSDRNLHLLDEHLDMAVRIGALPDSSMVATRIGSMRMVVCASPNLLGSHGAPKRPEDLSSLPCVNFEPMSGASIWPFRRPGGAGGVDIAVTPRLSVTTAEAAVWAASQDVGATRVLHYQCAEAVRSGALRIVLPEFEPDPIPIHLIHAARGASPLKMRSFLDFATTRLRHRLEDVN
ncbi:LysR family transcriptional regulator [Caulobacter sp. S45]|uniref:LysR family transcriptional regulator n=1 Tax=Caulobacter sp. S45 TaxID=1641861 RepID=UPI00131BD66B|nr:LysR family transcriptional regulator [Caulobacter sp. S45]